MKNRKKPTDWAGLFIVLGLLIIAIGSIPLIDPSEARYATIAQRMVLSKQWLIPEIDRGEGFAPFWGKPPLHIWLVALSMKFFGFSEFAARFPSYISLCLIIFLCSRFTRHLIDREVERILPFVILTSPLLIGVGLACLIDATFYLWTTLALVSFALTVEQKGSKRWRYLFFLGIGAGFLTKGPLAIALVGFVTGGWVLYTKRWQDLKQFPWMIGACIVATVATPWFFVAEVHSPGLIKYFFVNENFQRFTSSSYVDYYGSSHPTFRGVIALYFLIALLPLGIFFLKKIFSGKERMFTESYDQWSTFLILWALAPVAVFFPSNNVLVTYMLPGTPAIGILFAQGIVRWKVDVFHFVKRYYRSLFLLLIVMGAGTAAFEKPHFATEVAWLVVIWIVYRLAKHARESITKAMYVCLGLEATVVWILFVFSPWCSDFLSTKLLIHSLDEDDAGLVLTFSNKLPYSALFYLQADPTTRNALPEREDRKTTPKGDLAIRRDDLGELSTEQLKLLEKDEGTKNWAIVDTDKDNIK